MHRRIPCSAGNWPFARHKGFWLAFACLCTTASGPESNAADLLITAQRESNSNLRIEIPRIDARSLGTLIYFFEKACGISGYLLGVNPFDQPGVEAYKKNMFALLGKPGYEEEAEKLRRKL